MRKVLLVLLLIMTMSIGTCTTFANEIETPINGDELSEYVDANVAKTQLSISGSTAYCKTTVTTKNSSTVNKMVVIVYYYKSGGTFVGSNTVTVNSSGNYFAGTTSRTLGSHGTYYAESYVKLYHNSQLIESFTLMTGNATY